MDRSPATVKALTVLAVAAMELNSELSIILSEADEMLAELDTDDPFRPQVLNIRDAAQQCATAMGFAAAWVDRQGVRVRGAATVEGLTR